MKTTITTFDLYLAATLLSKGFLLIGHYRDHKRSEFQFEGLEFDSYVNRYYKNQIKISPIEYSKAIRDLKNIMYNGTSFQPTKHHEKHQNMDCKILPLVKWPIKPRKFSVRYPPRLNHRIFSDLIEQGWIGAARNCQEWTNFR